MFLRHEPRQLNTRTVAFISLIALAQLIVPVEADASVVGECVEDPLVLSEVRFREPEVDLPAKLLPEIPERPARRRSRSAAEWSR